MATYTDYISTDDIEQVIIEIINVSVYVEPEIVIETNTHTHNDTEISTEAKRKMFYEKRLENITKCLKFLETT